jgi:hypothetical protein
MKSNSHSEWPEPLGRAAYHGIVGDVVKLISPVTEADPVNLLITFLVMFGGNWIGRKAYMKIGRTKHHTNEYLSIIGSTGTGRKGTGKDDVLEIFRLADQFSDKWSRRRIKGGLSSGEGVINQFVEPEDKPNKVIDKRLMIIESELSRTFKVMNRPDNILSEVLRQGWETGELRTLTKKPMEATGAHLSIIGHITPDALKKYLGESEFANGFGNRFLLALVKRSKVLPFPKEVEISEDLIDDLIKSREFADTPRSMTWDTTTRQMWKECYEEMTRPQLGIAGELLHRGDAHVIRLSMIYALLDRSETIHRSHLSAALEIWHYCDDSVRFLYGDTVGDRVADVIWNAAERSKRGLTRTDIFRLLSNNADRNDLDRALALLSQYDLVKRIEKEGRDVWIAR